MKKTFVAPEWHVVNLDTDEPMSELAAMSDEELERTMAESGYFENKALYRITDHYAARSIAGETVLVPVGEQTRKLNGYATFTETGQFLWDLLSKRQCTQGDLVYRLSLAYGRQPGEVQEDVAEFLDKAMQHGMIARSSA